MNVISHERRQSGHSPMSAGSHSKRISLRWRDRVSQRGFTLIELMVALLIGMLITGAMIVNYASLRRTFGLHDGMAQLQDSQRLILTMMSSTLQQAGYYANPAADTRDSALPAGATAVWAGATPGSALTVGQAVVGIGDGTGSGAGSDGVAVRFQTALGDGLMNCRGGTLPAGGPATEVWINTYQINGQNELTCSVNGDAPVPLVANVRRMRIEYGVDFDGNGSKDSYLPASVVTSSGRWNAIHSIRLSFELLDPAAPTPTPVPAMLIQLIDLKNLQ